MDHETLSTHPTVFAPGEDKLSMQELRALSPQAMLWRNRAMTGLSDALIMMVDDEMLNIEMTQAFLAEAGYRRFVYTDAPEYAMAMLRQQLPGVLLLDLSMPKVSGLEILAALREDLELRHVPVIVLTSSTDPQVKLKALALGAMDFLSKPVDPSELGLRIRNTLAASAASTWPSTMRSPGCPTRSATARKPPTFWRRPPPMGIPAPCCTSASMRSAASMTPWGAPSATSSCSASPSGWPAASRPRPAANSARSSTSPRSTASTATSSR